MLGTSLSWSSASKGSARTRTRAESQPTCDLLGAMRVLYIYIEELFTFVKLLSCSHQRYSQQFQSSVYILSLIQSDFHLKVQLHAIAKQGRSIQSELDCCYNQAYLIADSTVDTNKKTFIITTILELFTLKTMPINPLSLPIQISQKN